MGLQALFHPRQASRSRTENWVQQQLARKFVLVLAAARRGRPGDERIGVNAGTVDEPGSDSLWNRNGCAISGLITSIRKNRLASQVTY